MIFLYLLFYFILQLSLPADLFLFDVRPDLLLILVVFLGLFNFRRGLLLAFISGLFKDITSAGLFGLNILCFSLWVVAAGRLSKQIYKDNKFIFLLLVIIATCGNYAIYLFSNSVFTKGSFPGIRFLLVTILLEAGYNSLCAYLLFDVFKGFFQKRTSLT